MSTAPPKSRSWSWRSKAFRGVLYQVIVLGLIFAAGAYLFSNTLENMRVRGIKSGFDFITQPAGFGIGESVVPFDSSESYGKAFLVGLSNTFRVAILGIILATILGTLVGIGRLSRNLLVRTLPQPAHNPQRCPQPEDGAAYGRYLVTLASCTHCHTPHDGAEPVAGKEFAGGVEFPFPDGSVARSANITPDLETGIGSWSKQAFVNRFKPYRDAAQLAHVGPGERKTVMPWSQYAGMTERDLGAIYDYLRTLAPVRSEVSRSVAQR